MREPIDQMAARLSDGLPRGDVLAREIEAYVAEKAKRIEALEAMLQEVVMDLENEIDGRYSGGIPGDQPAMDRAYNRDIEVCRRARKLLAERCSQGAR